MIRTSQLLAIVLGFAFPISGCHTVAENARLELAEDASSAFHVLITHPSERGPSGPVPPEQLLRFESLARNCGGTTRLFGRQSDGRHVLQIQLGAKNHSELEVSMACAVAADSRFPVFAVTTSEGIVSRQTTLRVSAEIRTPFLEFGTGKAPSSIQVTMPAAISSFASEPTIDGDIAVATIAGNRATIALASVPFDELPAALRIERSRLEKEAEAFIERECKPIADDCFAKLPKHTRLVSFEISSSKNKVTLQDVFALLGVVLGTGLVFELGKRLHKRKAEK